jgi:hypothetical protein
MNDENLIKLQKEIDELRTKRFEMLEEIDDLKRKLSAVCDLNTKILDNQATPEDFTLPYVSTRITPELLGYSAEETIKQLEEDIKDSAPSSITEDFILPNYELEDIRYFRDRVNQAFKVDQSLLGGYSIEDVKNHLSLLESSLKTIQNVGQSTSTSATIEGVKPMSNFEGSLYSIKPRYESSVDAFERAMKVVE